MERFNKKNKEEKTKKILVWMDDKDNDKYI